MSTKDEIIKAATQLFAEKGYEGMTMKEIAKEVGIKAPSVYAFFKSKEDVFLHIYREILNNHLQIASHKLSEDNHLSAKDQLEQLLETVIEFQIKEAMKMKVLLRLMLFPPEFMDEGVKAQFLKMEKQEKDMLSAIFKRAMEMGEIKEGDSQAIAATMICLMDGFYWQMQRYEEEVFRERFKVIWEQFWLGIKK